MAPPAVQLAAHLLSLLALAGAPAAPSQPARSSPLLTAARDLRCAADEPEARKALAVLRNADTEALGLPDEELGAHPPAYVYAATVDVVLDSIWLAITRFPAIHRDAEAVALSWSYCEVNREDLQWDLVPLEGGGVARRPAAGPFPLDRAGFRRWGFLKEDPPDRYVPRLIIRSGLAPDEVQLWVHVLRADRCIPDSRFGTTVYDDPRPPYTDAPPPGLPVVEQAPPAAYPYTLEPCPPPPPKKVAGAKEASKGKGKDALAKADPPNGGKKGTTSPVPPLTAAAQSKQGLVPPGGGLFKGSAYLTTPLEKDVPHLGTTLLVSPYSYFFVRGGLDYALRPKSPLGLSWGLGYDDWHPNTFSFQLNQWEPATLNKGLDLQNAVLNVGYKLPSPCVGDFCAAPFAYVDVPYNLNAQLGFRTTVTFRKVWFLMGGASVDLKPPFGLHFSYGMGLLDWKPFTFSATYFNWGNTDPTPKGGAFTVNWSWAF